MRSRSFIIIAAFVASLAVGATACVVEPPAPPQSTIDQSVTTGVVAAAGGDGPGYFVAQTFTAGRSGTLDKVSLSIGEGTIGPVNIMIQTAPFGVPTGTVLSSTIYNGPYVPQVATMVVIPLATSVTVTAGVKYAIVMQSLTGPVNLSFTDQASYSGGQAMTSVQSPIFWAPLPYQMFFATWVY